MKLPSPAYPLRCLSAALAFLVAGGPLRSEEARHHAACRPPALVPPPAGSAALPLPPAELTLREAENYALAHQAALAASLLRAQAETQRVYEERSQFFPQLQANAVGVKADENDSRLAATNGITNPTILTRQSDGGMLSQLITDFGRTYFLTTSARANALSASQRAGMTRQKMLFRVDQAYFAVEGAQALLKVANQTVSTDELLLERVKALASGRLKSSLDVSFQQVATAQARLLQLQTQARLQEALAELSASLGLDRKVDFVLVPQDLGAAPPGDVAPLLAEAWQHRPDLQAARADREAALRFAKAEHAAQYPVITAQGGMGVTPATVNGELPRDYAAFGVNVSIPVFTGGLLTAREREAALRAQAAEKTLEAAQNEAARDVFDAWVEARTAFEGIAVSKELLASSEQAFQLAQSRYQVGTSSIVELSQASLLEIQAQINDATSRFDYQVRRRALDLQMGILQSPIPAAAASVPGPRRGPFSPPR